MNFNENIAKIEQVLGYTFRDKSLLKQAFTRASYCNEMNRGKTKYMSNEVLEFFGDSVLSTAIITLLLRGRTERYEFGLKTELNEGDFSVIRSNLSDKKNLSATTKALGLQKYLLLSRGDQKLEIENEPSVMEDLYESIIGAVYIDSGMNLSVAIAVVERTLDVSEYISNKNAPKKNAKNLLQEWCDDKKHRLPHPEYRVLSESGPDNKKMYECGVYIGEKLYGKGSGKNQKQAEAAAAEVALEILTAEERQPKIDPSEVAAKMRDLASKNKVPSAEYRDLGETENSTLNVKEFAIECRFMGNIAVGTGLSKQDARAAAAKQILDKIELENSKKSTSAKAKKQENKTKAKKTTAKKSASEKTKNSESKSASEKLQKTHKSESKKASNSASKSKTSVKGKSEVERKAAVKAPRQKAPNNAHPNANKTTTAKAKSTVQYKKNNADKKVKTN